MARPALTSQGGGASDRRGGASGIVALREERRSAGVEKALPKADKLSKQSESAEPVKAAAKGGASDKFPGADHPPGEVSHGSAGRR